MYGKARGVAKPEQVHEKTLNHSGLETRLCLSPRGKRVTGRFARMFVRTYPNNCEWTIRIRIDGGRDTVVEFGASIAECDGPI